MFQATADVLSDEQADITIEAALRQQVDVINSLIGVQGVSANYGLVTEAISQALYSKDDAWEDEEETNWENPDGDSEEEEAMENTNEEDHDEDMVSVRHHVRRPPAPALVLSVNVLRRTSFAVIEAYWPRELIDVFTSRLIRPEYMNGLQQLVLHLFSRFRAEGAALLSKQ